MKCHPTFSRSEVLKERKQTVMDTVAFMLHLFAWYLHDEQGFGHDRLQKALAWLDNHAGEYMTADGEVSLTDVHNMLINEVGININFDKERMH